MILADISGQFIFLIVFAAIGVINWWMEKRKKDAASGSTPQITRPQHSAGADSGGESEQERLRRFLEALGVPQPPAQQPPRPQPVAPAPAPRPARRPVVQTMERRAPSPRPQPRVVRAPKRPVFPEPEEFKEAGRLEEPARSIERIAGEFEQMNVRVAMQPVQSFEQPDHLAGAFAGTTSVLTRQGSPIATSLRKLLHNPTELRAAFVAMELLGPPKGLKS